MRWLRKFWRLDETDRRLLLKAVVVVLAIRIALWTLPLETLRKLVNRHSSWPKARPVGQVDPERLAKAVAAAARRIPDATCLTQALSLHLLCRRRGIATQLQIGVSRTPAGAFRAHAWIEQNGKVLIGYLSDLHVFVPMPSVGL